MPNTWVRRCPEPTTLDIAAWHGIIGGVETRFINADLDIWSRRSLADVVSALDRVGLFALNGDSDRRAGRWYACFELSSSPGGTAEKCARKILRSLDRLTRAERAALSGCSSRVLNLGYDVGATWAFTDTLSAETTQRLAAFGIGVAITLYPEQPHEQRHGTAEKRRARPRAQADSRRRRAPHA